MAGTDYAADLLGGGDRPAQGARATAALGREESTDYAAALFGPSLVRENAKKPKELSLADLKVANAESHEGTADFGTLVKANMVEDPGTKVRIYAQARFPKLAEKEAVSRYGIVEGHVVYVGEDGKMYREDPPGFTGWLKDSLAAGTVADLPALIGGIAGATAGAPSGPAGMITLGAAGAAGGKGYGKVIANLALDEPQTVEGNIKSIAGEGLFSAGGNYAGSLFGKFLTRNLARDISKLDGQAVADLQSKASSIGVELDPAQLTNLPSLKAKKDVLASMPTSRDIIAQGSQKQAGQARQAVDSFLDTLSAKEGLDEAGAAAKKSAGDVIEMVTKERSSKASPLYQKAFEEFQGIPQELLPRADSLMGRPAMKEAGKKAVMLAKNEGVDLADPKNSLLGMHYMKLALDDMIEGAGQQGFGGTYKRGLVGLKNQLVGIMDELSPTYGEARKVFTHFTPNVMKAREGIVSALADMNDEQLHQAVGKVFGGNISPSTVAQTKALFERAGAKDTWNQMTKAYLQDAFENAGRQFKTTGGALEAAPNWQVAMTGSARQYRILEKALDPAEFQAFKDMMDVFEAMGRTRGAGAGSQTMTRQEGAKLLREESGAGMIGRVAQLGSPQNIGSRVGEWLQEVRVGDHAEQLAQVMTSPQGMQKLRELKRLSPNDERFLAGASTLFGIELKPTNKPAEASTE